MGGEHRFSSDQKLSMVGSPPHGRGALRRASRFLLVGGLTPAWAGSTASGWSLIQSTRAHPRMGGEHQDDRYSEHHRGAHPRMGGEHGTVLIGQVTILGSPPHGRGARAGVILGGDPVRLTPAWAGSTV